MRAHTSPWLKQLKSMRVQLPLEQDIETDVAIVGGGIAGISSAFFALKYTSKRVVLVESGLVAHGATGHNAGQVVSYFERGFKSLVDEFGLRRAAQGQESIERAWELLEEMYTDANLDIPFARFMGHAAVSTEAQVRDHLEDNRLRQKAGLKVERIRIADDAPFLSMLEDEYGDLYEVTTREELAGLIETTAPGFVAVISYQKGCINSALLCDEVVRYLLSRYKDRFTLYEHTPISKVVLHHGFAILDACDHTITAKRVVLATNGFETITILNETGLDIDAKFHHLVEGWVGYMSAYLEKMERGPMAISYFTDSMSGPEPSYFYVTRRNYEHEGDPGYNLVSVGGPDRLLPESMRYTRTDTYPEEAIQAIDRFVRTVYQHPPEHKIEYLFTWHGLMGYTKNRVRLIGPEPKNPVLLYNLGCNGVGILPSVYGGKQLVEYLENRVVERTMFDVPEC